MKHTKNKLNGTQKGLDRNHGYKSHREVLVFSDDERRHENKAFSVGYRLFLSNLKVTDVKWLLVDVDSVGACSQTTHGGQVATVAPHCLNDEHSPLGAASWLFDAITCLIHTHIKQYTIIKQEKYVHAESMQMQNTLYTQVELTGIFYLSW